VTEPSDKDNKKSPLIVELDGGQHADRLAQDEQRSEYLSARGFRVLRFWNNDVLGNTDAFLR
jgi:very-short-patch-repair endonuclease